ncbi:MAG TPA: LCP family protein, partial [Phototrophicaceae bacterium]|nr:LCP family protein [Phototrophicaceae bacterium]
MQMQTPQPQSETETIPIPIQPADKILYTPPTLPMTRRSRRKQRGCLPVVLIAGVILFTVCTLCSIAGLTAYLLFPPPPLNVVVLGVDARPGEGYFTRTDVIMLAGIQPGGLKESLLSIPRDLFIDVPGYGQQRINTINSLGEQNASGGGITLLQQAVEQDFDISTSRYVRLNFQGFVALIDAVGGVTIDVQQHIVDYNYPTVDGGTQMVEFQVGVQQMDGERALVYARTRHADDDYHRAARQQQVVSAVVGKLANPLNWSSAI